MSVEAAGFKTKVTSGITVRSGDQLSLSFPLEVGAAAEVVNVTGEVPQLETASASISQVVERRFLDLLYMPNRNPLMLVSLTPGVTQPSQNWNAGNLDAQQNQFTINGSSVRNGGNEIIIDGASMTVPRQNGAVAASPSGDSVEELRVQTTMFDAAYGRTTGGVVSYATRGGTNEIHGSFESFYRNKVFNANGWFNNKNNVPRKDVNKKLVSGTLGGPVYLPKIYDGRNRTFFFFSLQKEENRNPQSYLERVPTAQEREGDFSNTLNAQGTPLQIYDPYSTVVSGGKATRTMFPGAKIPASRFDRVGSTIAKIYPLPNLTVPNQLGVANWATGTTSIDPGTNMSVRLDENINARHRLFGRVGLMRFDGKNAGGLPRGYQKYEGEYREFWSASVNNDFTLTPTFLATIRYSFGRVLTESTASSLEQDPKELNMPDVILRNAEAQVWPQINLEGHMQMGGRIKFRANDTHSIVPTFHKLAGNHTLRFGGDVRMINWNSRELGYAMTGSFNFNGVFTRSDPFTASTGSTSGNSIASLLMGNPSGGSFGSTTPYSMRSFYYASFIQDDWKVNSRLTLNIGLRWELETPYSERFNRMLYGFDYAARTPVQIPGMDLRGGLLFAGANGTPRALGKTDTNNFGPRFGLAYSLDRNTVIRAGYGLFYSSNINLVDQYTAIPASFSRSLSYVASTDNNATPYTTLSNPFPEGVPPVQGSSLGLATRLGDGIGFIDQDRVAPYTQQWQVGIQRTLPWKIKLEANFVRMLSLKLPENFNLNDKPDRYLALGAAENTKVPNPFYKVLPANSPLGASSTISQKQLWLAYPQFTGVTVNGAPVGIAPYNALQLSVEKRLSHGITVLANYSISKQLQNNISSLVNPRPQNRSVSWMARCPDAPLRFGPR